MMPFRLRFIANNLLWILLFWSDLGLSSDTFGAPFSGQSQNIELTELANQYQKHQGQLVQLRAKVKQVCEKKGCWMVLDDGQGQIRVTFKDYSFFVPRKLNGQTVTVEGFLQKKTRSVAEQQHFLSDEGASPTRIKAVTEPLVTYEFEAHSVSTSRKL